MVSITTFENGGLMPAAKTLPERTSPAPESDLMTWRRAPATSESPVGTLYQWASRKNRPSPRSVRIGRYRRYRKADLDLFIEENTA